MELFDPVGDRLVAQRAGVVLNSGGELSSVAVTAGPTANAVQPANAAGNVVVKNASGYLRSATITTLGTAGLIIYDNASTNSGTILLSIPASAAVGTIYAFPDGAFAANGIVSAGVTSCPAVTFQYN